MRRTRRRFYQTLALQANAEGITWVSGAGDSGAAGCDGMGSASASGGYFAEAPASAPSVTASGRDGICERQRWSVLEHFQ